MTNKKPDYALALPISTRGFLSAQEIIEAHIDKEKIEGSVYFSTSNRIDPKKAPKVINVILVNKSFTYIADLEAYVHFDEKSAPNDVNVYAPDIFSKDQDNHWFRLSNIRKINLDELNAFEMVNKKSQAEHNGVGNYITNTGRLQIFYAKKSIQ